MSDMKGKFVFAALFLAGAAFAFCETAQEPVVIGTDVEALEENGKTPVHQAEAPSVDKEDLSKKEAGTAEVIDIDLYEDGEEPEKTIKN